jgi:hypothetical protein
MKNITNWGISVSAGFLLAFFFLMAPPRVIAQIEDNPNLDQIPRYLREVPTTNDHLPLSTVITIGNWDNFNLGVAFAENNISVNPLQPTWFFTAYNTNASYHTENGHDWTTNNPNFGATMAGDPVSAYDSLGNLFYENMWQNSSGAIQGCKVIPSTTNGATWGTSVTGITGNDKNWIACDQTSGPYANYIYTVMTNNGQGNFARSMDHGATYQSTFTPSSQSLPGMMVAVGANGNTSGGAVFVVTNSGSSFASNYTFYKSTDGGATFTNLGGQQFAGYVGTDVNGRNSVEGMRTRPYPMITADNSFGSNRGRLHLVYASNDPPGNGNKPDIWNRYSDDGGDTWSAAHKVNDDPNTTQNHQWHPATWCDKETGRLYVMWMDTRDTPTRDSAYIYATYSDDGGVTFVPNQRISNKKMKINCTSCGGGGTPRYQGDYNGIVSNGKVSMVAWTDFRSGSFMSATAYFPDFALAIDHNSDTLYTPSDNITFDVSVPEVKLYSDTVILSGVVTPAPTSGSITFSFPQGNTITSFPNNKPALLTLAGNVPTGNYQAVITAAGPNGTPVHKRTATIKVLPGNGFLVTAGATPDSVCQGSTVQLSVTVTGGTAPFAYSWTSNPEGFTSNLQNPSASPTASAWYKVVVNDATTTEEDSVWVFVNVTPPMPGPISGSPTACVDGTVSFSVTEVQGATSYSWTVPADAQILNGQNTPSVSVKWGSTSGNVSVIAGNDCGTSAPSVLAVTVSMVPDQPGAITGPEIVCTASTIDYSIDEVPMATSYSWTVPVGSDIIEGQGTRQIKVIFGEFNGTITVSASNTCGNGPVQVKTIVIDSLPDPAGPITGNDTVCQNRGDYVYSVPAIPHAQEYLWTLPAGAEITAGQGTNEVTLYFGQTALSGEITVKGVSSCGEGSGSSMNILVNSCAGIHENNLNAQVSLFPNPVSGELTISINGSETRLELVITDVNGHINHAEMLQPDNREFKKKLDVSAYARGVYFIRLSNGEATFTDKFIVK